MQLRHVLPVVLLLTACPTLPGIEDAGSDAGRPIPPPAIDLAVGATHACARMADRTVRCWGSYSTMDLGALTRDGLPTPQPSVFGAERLALGRDFGCAVYDAGTFCWGVGDVGQLGNGDTQNSNALVAASTVGQDVSAGSRHACLRAGTAVRCWGDNRQRQLGDGTTSDQSTTSVSVVGLNAAQVDLGLTHSCALLLSGTVACWGDNAEGQLGDGTNSTRNTPTPLMLGQSAFAVSAGRQSCALLADRSVSCWGAMASLPSQYLSSASAWQEIAVGGSLVCARAADGNVRCLSRADAGFDVTVPNAVQLGAGDAFTCALTDGGTVYCWGKNDLGQLGDGQRGTDSLTVPVKVGF